LTSIFIIASPSIYCAATYSRATMNCQWLGAWLGGKLFRSWITHGLSACGGILISRSGGRRNGAGGWRSLISIRHRSLAPERDERIHLCCPARGNPAGQQRNAEQQTGDHNKSQRVGRTHAKQEARKKAHEFKGRMRNQPSEDQRRGRAD